MIEKLKSFLIKKFNNLFKLKNQHYGYNNFSNQDISLKKHSLQNNFTYLIIYVIETWYKIC